MVAHNKVSMTLSAKILAVKSKGKKRRAKAGKPIVSQGETKAVMAYMAPKLLEMLKAAITNGKGVALLCSDLLCVHLRVLLRGCLASSDLL